MQLWHVYVFAFLFGCAAAFDAPVRQTFVAELVGEADLSNAIALNSTSFNAARMIGPAVAGLVIASIGTGWAFLLNAASFVAVLGSLTLLRTSELRPQCDGPHAHQGRHVGGFSLRLVPSRSQGDPDHAVPDRHVRAELSDLHLDHGGQRLPRRCAGFGLLSSMMAIGTISGALLAAGREKPRFISLLLGRCGLRARLHAGGARAQLLAVRGSLVVIGVAALTVTNTSQRHDAALDRAAHAGTRDGDAPRRRAGRHADRRTDRRMGGATISGPRWALGVGAAAGFAAALVAVRAMSARTAEVQSE